MEDAPPSGTHYDPKFSILDHDVKKYESSP